MEAGTETTVLHELVFQVGPDFSETLLRFAEELAHVPAGTRLVVRYERRVRLHEPLSAAANRLSASVPPAPHGKGPAKKGRPPKSPRDASAPKPAVPVRAPIRVVPAPQPKREPPAPERPPIDYEPTFTRTPIRDRLKQRRAAEAAT